MMHEIQQFSPIDLGRWARLKSGIKDRSGVDITDDKGIAEAHGARVSYEYDPGAQTLTLQLLDKPFFIGEVTVNQIIHNFVERTV